MKYGLRPPNEIKLEIGNGRQPEKSPNAQILTTYTNDTMNQSVEDFLKNFS